MCKPFAVLVYVKYEQHVVIHCDESMLRSATDSGLKWVVAIVSLEP